MRIPSERESCGDSNGVSVLVMTILKGSGEAWIYHSLRELGIFLKADMILSCLNRGQRFLLEVEKS